MRLSSGLRVSACLGLTPASEPGASIPSRDQCEDEAVCGIQYWRGQTQPILTSHLMSTNAVEHHPTTGQAGGAHPLVCDGRKASACVKTGNILAATEMLVTEPTATSFPDYIFETAQVKACLLQ